MPKDFWNNSTIVVMGGGSFGSVLAYLASKNAREVRLWTRDEDQVRNINATRINKNYWPQMQYNERVHAFNQLERAYEGGVHGVIWALPSGACREVAKKAAGFFTGEEVLIHATKGIEQGSLKRVSQVLREEIPCPRIGVISGPNLAREIADGEPAATVVASQFKEVIKAGTAILSSERFRVYGADDVIGVEWAGTLKNILAIASGALDAMKFGWNARAMLITRGLAEMVRFGVAMGAQQSTFLGLAGAGDLLATCSSPNSRNYRVGFKLAQGEPLDRILRELGSTAEGVRTTDTVHKFARENDIYMPITEGVHSLLKGEMSVREVLDELMLRPAIKEF